MTILSYSVMNYLHYALFTFVVRKSSQVSTIISYSVQHWHEIKTPNPFKNFRNIQAHLKIWFFFIKKKWFNNKLQEAGAEREWMDQDRLTERYGQREKWNLYSVRKLTSAARKVEATA